jgi:hypothetical protein
MALGIWLVISAFAWTHMMGERANTWVLGLLIVLASLGAMYAPRVRFLTTLFAIWLFIATLVIPHSQSETLWNNCIVAVLVFVLSLIPSSAAITTGGRRPIPAS